MIVNQVASFDRPEIRIDFFQHCQSAFISLVVRGRLCVLWFRFGVLQDKRIVINAQETRAASISALAANSHEAWNIEIWRATLLCDVRAKGGELDAAHRQVAMM